MYEERSVIETLLDADDDSNISLYDEDGNEVEFEQIATVPYLGETYSILRPVGAVDGFEEGDMAVFMLDLIDRESDNILTVQDEDLAAAIFAEYERMSE